MDNRNADILQIKMYLEGKLDTRAMYELERRALDDPFLMDAMEGYQTAGNQHNASAELAGRLAQRLQKPEARVISIGRLAVAASVITLLGLGGWWMLARPTLNNTEVAMQMQADKTIVDNSPLIDAPQIVIHKDSLVAFNTPKTVIRSPRRKRVYREPAAPIDMTVSADETAEIASSTTARSSFLDEAPVAMRSRAKTDSVPFNEMVVMGYTSQRKKANAQQDPIKEQTIAASKVAATVVSATIKGKVVSDDDQPLPGVAVRAGNSTRATFTDGDGAYTLNVDSLNTDITYKSIGYRARTLNAKDAPAKVTLEPEAMMLHEVVIDKAAVTQPDAQPKNGWENYQKYLNANSVSPNGKAKSYRVSFTVEKDGSLSNFEINKADNDMAGQKAIQLIKNGPEWVGSPKGQPRKITLTVEFHKPEK